MNDEITQQYLHAIEETCMWHTVGIVANRQQELGTGIALQWRERTVFLTANHVIQDTPIHDLRFIFRPSGNLKCGDVRDIHTKTQSFERVSVIGVDSIESSEDLDLAVMEVSRSLDSHHNCRFFELQEDAATPDVGHTVLLIGFPSGIARPVRPGEYAVFTSMEWTAIEGQRQVEGYNPQCKFLMQYHSAADDMHPGGFSGAGVWFRKGSTGKLWNSNVGLAGVITRYYLRLQLLEAVKIDHVILFLNSLPSTKGRAIN